MADSRVRRRHHVEPINFIDMIIERAAHDEPHDHFNPLGASLTQVVKMIAVKLSKNRRSHSLLIRPARGPLIW
jgi:hypothetical protein